MDVFEIFRVRGKDGSLSKVGLIMDPDLQQVLLTFELLHGSF